MRICCLSDLHGALPEIPDADLLLLGGDYCPTTQGQNWWLRDHFLPWLSKIAERMPIVGVAGNHDFLWEKRPDLVPRLPWTYLQDSETTVNGLRIYGSPWQPRFFDWAFNLDEPDLSIKWNQIPEGIDVLLLHAPPAGAGDTTNRRERIGSFSLRARIEAIKPMLVVCGHNHEGYGLYRLDNTIIVNAAHMNDQYRPVNPPQVVELAHR